MPPRRFIPTSHTRYPGGGYSAQLVYALVLLSLLAYCLLPRARSLGAPAQLRAAAARMDNDVPAALAAIAAAAASGATSLDLSNRGLRALPPSVCDLAALETLNLAGNALEDLPPELERLTALRTLFFLGNRFTHIPRVVGRLPRLFMLSFKSNKLAAIAEDALPPSLGWLILTDNRLESLPASLGGLRHLRKLMLASNQLRELPDLSGLASLELVRLSDNALRAAPVALLSLPRLAWVALAGNAFPPLARDDVPAALAAAPQGLQEADVELGAVLGEGASGTVRAGARRDGGGAVAVKAFKAASSDGRPMDEVRPLPQARAPPPFFFIFFL